MNTVCVHAEEEKMFIETNTGENVVTFLVQSAVGFSCCTCPREKPFLALDA